ncbi:MAG: HDOD domain-containing protein [Candidatus Latescibacteria bacterium]|nr:HDOD domain-containing protein [Candidatus Latescibacterota bacterium]
MKKILFVDDEPNILQALKRSLRNMRVEWDMDFAISGDKALEILAQERFDVIVTDMRMPGMNGLELLNAVRNKYPYIIRFVLSGHADKDFILRSVGPIHQYLTKPCDTDELKTMINKACSTNGLLIDSKLQELISQMETLPSLPLLYTKLMAELESPEASIKSVAKIISQDIGMSAKILQLVNSTFFGIRHHVASPEQAVSLLGMDIVSALVLSINVFEQFDSMTLEALSLSELWNHSRNVGMFAKKIAEYEKIDNKSKDYAFIAGLLHDIGKLILAVNIPETYKSVIEDARKMQKSVIEGELKNFGVTHEKIGGYLMGLWGFPQPVIEAIASHHSSDDIPSDTINPLTAVKYANIIEHKLFQDGKMSYHVKIDVSHLKEHGLDTKFPIWESVCQQIADEASKNES